MPPTRVPSTEDFYLPLLKAASELGPSTYEKIDTRALEIVGVVGEEADLGTPSARTPVAKRLGWARSILKKVGLLERAGPGVWAETAAGRAMLERPAATAMAAIRDAADAAYARRQPDQETLNSWASAAASDRPHSLTVQELIRLWGVERRWESVNQKIQDTLAAVHLSTDPDFRVGSLHASVRLVRTKPAAGKGGKKYEDPPFLAIGTLPSSNGGVVGVSPSDNLLRAQSLMSANDYSQLSVMNGERDIKGAISWESIARARLINPDATLRDCMVEPEVARYDRALLDLVPAIIRSGFVFVQAADKRITGLVTTADLSEQFVAIGRPFLLVGEIEGGLRTAIDAAFSADELYEFLDDADSDREIEAARSLTLGEIQRIVENPDAWARLRLPADRTVFIDRLNRVRRIRNDVAHFSPDPLTAEDMEILRTFLRWIRELLVALRQ